MSGSSELSRGSSRVLVLDSWPVMEWLKGRQPVADRFLALLESALSKDVRLLLSSINLGEIYYNCWREWGELRANEVLALLTAHPIQVIHPAQEDVLAAAKVKALHSISYADAFVVALANTYGGRVVTGDPDFLLVAHDGSREIELEWVGA